MHPFCLQPGILAFDAATKGLAQLLYTTQHLSLTSPSWADLTALITTIASIAWAVSSFDAGAFKHRQVWLPATSNRSQLTRLVVLRMAELLLLVTTLTCLTHLTTKATAIIIYIAYSTITLALCPPHPSVLQQYVEWLPVAAVLYLNLRSPSATVLRPKPYFTAKLLLAALTAVTTMLWPPPAPLSIALIAHGIACSLLVLLFPSVSNSSWIHKQPPARRAVRSLVDCSPRQAVAASTMDHSKRVLDELATSGMFGRRQQVQRRRPTAIVAAGSVRPKAYVDTGGHGAPSFIHDTSAIAVSDDEDHDNRDNNDSNDNDNDNHGSGDGIHAGSARRILAFEQPKSPVEPETQSSGPPRLRAWMQTQPQSLRLLAAAGRALKPTVRSSSVSPPLVPALAAPSTTRFPTARTAVHTWKTSFEPEMGLDTSLFGARSTHPTL
jgi:hypothetical protein